MKPIHHPTSATNPRTPATKWSLPNSWHNAYNYWRFQYQLWHQATAPGLLKRSKSCSCRRSHYSDQVVSHSHNFLHPRCQPNLIPSHRCDGAHRPHWLMGHVKNPCQQWLPSRNTLSIHLQKKWVMARNNSRSRWSPSTALAARESSPLE
jgi:hypothetical protein